MRKLVVSLACLYNLILVGQSNSDNIFKLIDKGDEASVIQYLDAGHKIDSTDNYGNSLLLRALGYKQISISNLLIEQGANVLIENYKGLSPVLIAVRLDTVLIIEKIINRGIDINSIYRHGYTLLKIATENNNLKIIEWLLEQGADVNLVDHKNRTALFYAEAEAAKILIEYGTKINLLDKNGHTALSFALEQSRIETVRHLFNNGAKIVNKQGITSLMVAAACGDMGFVKNHFNKEDINAIGPNQYTALIYSLQFKNQEISSFIINQKDDFSRSEQSALFLNCNVDLAKTAMKRMQNPRNDLELYIHVFHNSLKCNTFEMAQFLIDLGVDINESTNSNDYMYLMDAARDNNLDEVKFLVSNGAVIDTTGGPYGYTALMYAAKLKDGVEIIDFLLKAGADKSIKDDYGMTALVHASRYNNYDCAKILLENGDKVNDSVNVSPLIFASLSGGDDTKLIELLLEYGADVKSTDDYGHTALMGAVRTGSIEKTEILLKFGVNPKAENKEGLNIGMLAIHSGNIALLKLLIEKSAADVNLINSKGKTLLMHAAHHGNPEIISYLIDLGAKIDKTDSLGYNPILYASISGNVKSVEILLKNGADINSKSLNGYTLLMYSAQKNYVELVSLLIKEGIDINVKNNEKEQYSALDYAKKNRNDDIVEMLINAGAIE